MGRFRQAAPAGSRYITPQGERRLREELEQLWRDERPRVTQAVAAAAAQGDRSENAEYTYGKRRLREIDRRVRFLRQRLEGMVIVDGSRRPIRAGCSSAPGCRLRPTTGSGCALPHRRSRRIRPRARLHQHGLAARAGAAAQSARR